MQPGRFGQTLEIIAAFQHADEAVGGPLAGDLHKPAGDPVEIVADQVDLRQRIAVVGVEPGRQQYEVGPERVERRQDAAGHRLAERTARVIGPERGVDDIADTCLVLGAGARIERHLVRRAIEHRWIVPEDILRAITVVHIPVDNGNTLGAMLLLRIARRDCRRVEEAEAHRRVLFGVVAGWPGRSKAPASFKCEGSVGRQALTSATSDSITGTSTSTPTTVARAAPLFSPKSEMATATASSKKLLAPINAAAGLPVGTVYGGAFALPDSYSSYSTSPLQDDYDIGGGSATLAWSPSTAFNVKSITAYRSLAT
eukprot:gene29520-39124_t